MKKINQKGFTLIELLVVIAIIGLLSTLAVVSLNNARTKSRDARRVADIKQIQTALELYFTDASLYPLNDSDDTAESIGGMCISTGTTPRNGLDATCSGAVTYMGAVPTNPSPNGSDYMYLATTGSGTIGSSYTLTYTLEQDTGGIAAGANTATPNGIND